MTVLLLLECLIVFPIKEQKLGVRLVHTEKSKRQHLGNETREMRVIPIVSCQAYLDIYFYKHSEQRLQRNYLLNLQLDFFSPLPLLDQLGEFSSLLFNNNANNQHCNVPCVITFSLPASLTLALPQPCDMKKDNYFYLPLIIKPCKGNTGALKIILVLSDCAFVSSFVVHWTAISGLHS